jgi:aminoglycoside phosphotransferase (APT) family kinase protein
MPLGEPDVGLLAPVLHQVFGAGPILVHRVAEGVSTWVYRIRVRGATYYLRVLPEAGASFAPEVAIHQQLRRRQVKVPRVLHFEACYEPLQRSIMVVDEVPGRPVSASAHLEPPALHAILLEAGRDLAHLNAVPVTGFGWVTRTVPPNGPMAPLASAAVTASDAEAAGGVCAPLPTYRAFMLGQWEADLTFLAAAVLATQEVTLLERIRARYEDWLETGQSRLAHGDFDTTAIYQEQGRYTGIIDFGEICGASRWYDLAHFRMRDGEYLPLPLLPALLQGYASTRSLPETIEQQIHFESLLVNVRALARSLRKRPPNRYTHHQLDRLRADLAALSS